MAADNTRMSLQLRSLVRNGELELSLVNVPIPEPAADEVLVRIEAAPINPSDLGLLFGVADMSSAKFSGTSANPARSFGPALIEGIDTDQWVYFVGPALGSYLAIGFIRLQLVTIPRVRVARLFHFHLD